MKTEVRFLLAIFLMMGVLVGTNMLFPPVVPDEVPVPDSVPAVEAGAAETGGVGPVPGEGESVDPVIPGVETRGPALEEGQVGGVAARVSVEGPLYRFEFSSVGALMVSAEMRGFPSFTHPGEVNLVPGGASGYLGHKLTVGRDTLDLTRVRFRVEPEGGLVLEEGSGPQILRFIYEHPTTPFRFAVEYEFTPESYIVHVRGAVAGVDRPLLVTDLGEGLAYSEADSVGEARSMAFVENHVRDGIRSTLLDRGKPGLQDGPFVWVAFRSKFFVFALLAGESEQALQDTDLLGGLMIGQSELPDRVRIGAAQSVSGDGAFAYRLFMGPQEYGRLSSLGQEMEEVNPYGWKFIRPLVRPIVSVIMTVLGFLHATLSLSYGWVLVVFGVMMRVILWPLNHKAMKAQLKNMAVQPMIQEAQARYKDNPEKLQKEMLRLYKEEGFNPLGGCLPMLLPWPVLIALFFVFQNTIELRGVPFLWLPDLSAADPLFILPAFLGLSMFLMQWVSMRALDQPNPQMKMMMWIMPIMMVFIFLKLPSGLNLYYATTNIATIPQQIWINNERKKVRGTVATKATK
ncbi:MAG: YidC/Oxa1 family insertase periplasmic-domain containing protein [Gemmatimonadota bacterium]|nr:YidC/Oxa1 family insertase periplasmic-domain containing protein [Gemmatimonadota bacterium]